MNGVLRERVSDETAMGGVDGGCIYACSSLFRKGSEPLAFC
jgi:hypothetical protein